MANFQNTKGATISVCTRYLYSLYRIWDDEKPKVLFVMLNPSTADSTKDDATIRRCIDYAKKWGYGGLYVTNLFAYRATDPKDLLKVDNPFGDKNIYYTKQISDIVDKVICAWGNSDILTKLLKGFEPKELLSFCSSKLHFIELSQNGTPKHPLYLKSVLIPQKWQ